MIQEGGGASLLLLILWTGTKVCDGGGRSTVNLVFYFGPNLFTDHLRFRIGPSQTILESKPKDGVEAQTKTKESMAIKVYGIVVETPEKQAKPINTNPKAMIVPLTISPPQTFQAYLNPNPSEPNQTYLSPPKPIQI